MSRRIYNKICLICGDKALGNNFDALSCESCKAFFRRNAIKTNVAKCNFNDNCKIDVFSRRFCKTCRLRKCFEVGMKTDYILTSEQKLERKNRIDMYRININTEESNGNTSSEVTSPDSSQSDNNLQVSSNSIESTDNTSSLDTSQSYNTDTSLDIPDTFEDLDLILDLDFNVEEIDLQANEIETIINGDVIQHDNSTANNTIDVFTDFNDDISELVYQKAIEHEFTVIPISRPTTDHTYVFNELEGFKLTELFGATEIFSETLSVVSVTSMARDYADLVRVLSYKIDEQVMRAIRMSKKLQTFNNICETDRISLLKQGSLELYLIRSVAYYDSAEDHWTYNMGNNTSVILSLELMRVFPRNIYSFYKKFLHNICREWESDLLVLDLLTAIVLFNPDRPKLIDKDLVKLHQHIYMHLLRRYLLVRYRSHPESNVKFLRLLNCLIDLTVLGDVYRLNCADKDPDTIPPFMREMLNIRTKCDIEHNVHTNILSY